ncbi:MAG TPA: tetratricopeptide repeat protein [Methylomirabilota bacterium]|nr:tetratricopeptide repeat protein [Methylomirabilota bacterium]
MRTFFLFALLAWLLESPLLAALVLVAFVGGSYLLFSRRLYRWRQRWYDRARARHLEATLAVNPEDAKARSDLGSLLARRGRFAEALPHLEMAIRRSDDLPGPNFYLGWTLLNQGDLERGRSCIEAALAIDPRFGYGEPHLRLGDYFFGRREYRDAIPHYEACRGIHGSGMEAAAKLGECYLAVGDKERAAKLLSEALGVYRTLPWFGKQEQRGWARRAKAVLRRARVR